MLLFYFIRRNFRALLLCCFLLAFSFSVSAQTTITIGTQVIASGGSSSGPNNYYYKNYRIQWVITASEITDAGGSAGTITKIAFDVSEVAGGTLVDYQIRMKHTTATDASSHIYGPFTTVKSAHSFTTGSTGWRTITFDTNFDWDGSNNIVVDICWGTNSGSGTTGQVWLYNNVSNQMGYRRDDLSSTCSWEMNSTRSGKPRVQLTFDPALPVELSSFNAKVKERDVMLNWITQTEIDFHLFEVERNKLEKNGNENWITITSVNAHGNSNSPKEYGFSDNKLNSGNYQYRLKLVDNDGTFKYSDVISANIGLPKEFALYQNYPNPFNPSTVISYQLSASSNISLKIYDVLGNKIATLIDNEWREAGYYNFQLIINNYQLTTGVYFYRLQAGNFIATKKFVLMK